MNHSEWDDILYLAMVLGMCFGLLAFDIWWRS